MKNTSKKLAPKPIYVNQAQITKKSSETPLAQQSIRYCEHISGTEHGQISKGSIPIC